MEESNLKVTTQIEIIVRIELFDATCDAAKLRMRKEENIFNESTCK